MSYIHKNKPGFPEKTSVYITDPSQHEDIKFPLSPFRASMLIVLSVLLCEFIVMIIMSYLPAFGVLAGALFDGFVLTFLLAPVFYFFLYRPLVQSLKRQTQIVRALGESKAELTEANNALHESEEKSRAITQTAKDAIITIHRSGNIVFWNEAASNLFGYTETEIVGKPISQLIPQRYKEAHKKGIERAEKTGEHSVIGKTVELAGLKKDGSEFPLELSLSKWEAKEGVFYTGILRDISNRKQAEKQRDKLIADLQNALSEVKTLRDFLPICSHCKNIRDDKGYWSKIESYIQKHSDTKFSHGICPECAEKYYPDMDLYGDEHTQG